MVLSTGLRSHGENRTFKIGEHIMILNCNESNLKIYTLIK